MVRRVRDGRFGERPHYKPEELDEEICKALALAYEDPNAQISMFTSGAKFARDYYEKEIEELIGSIRGCLKKMGKMPTVGLFHVLDILNKFEGKDESNP